ncbi:unnamed protein product [Auanema sp. JU1783]|nr:unnamed protein product [Auanema sp. JU1783]
MDKPISKDWKNTGIQPELGSPCSTGEQKSEELVSTCRDLLLRDLRPGEKSESFVRLVLEKLFYDTNVDLCSIVQTHPAAGEVYALIRDLIHSKSAFFETIYDGSEVFANELWKAIFYQLEKSHTSFNVSAESVLMTCISDYVVRLLPFDQVPTERGVPKLHRAKTPLDLFLPTSPVLNSIKLDLPSRELSSPSLHPRHLTIFCNLVNIMCNRQQYPSANRLVVIRYLLKQFHSFCLFETTDSELMAIKKTIHSKPPFSSELYQFLYTFFEQCPSLPSLLELISVWNTYCRPWRYVANTNIPYEQTISLWIYFIRNEDIFYRILLGKILRKLSEAEITLESVKTIRTLVEWSWKDPMKRILREVNVDARQATRKVLDNVFAVYKMKQAEISSSDLEKKSFWDVLSAAPESPRVVSARQIVEYVKPLLEEGDKFMYTSYVTSPNVPPTVEISRTQVSPSTVVNDVLCETPKRGKLPDHSKDPSTGFMFLTPLGREQVFSGERKFKFDECKNILPGWIKSVQAHEFPPLVYLTQWLTSCFNDSHFGKYLSEKYSTSTVVGQFARIVMDPPYPNPYSPIQSPVFCRTLKRNPPSLRLRVFANYGVLLGISILTLFYVYGWYALIPLLVILVVGSIAWVATQEI